MMTLEDQKKAVENELAQKRQSINNSLNMQKLETDNTINRNNQYLDEQIKKMNTDKIVNDDKIAALQNRRGGFYSGGLDYQLAENLRNTTEGQTGLRRDTGTKNQELLGRYNTLASQAAEQIKQLEMETADNIRALVNAELERQRQAAATSRARAQQEAQAKPSEAELARLYQEYLASQGQPTNFFMTPNEATRRNTNVYAGLSGYKAADAANQFYKNVTNTQMTQNERLRRGL
jgi:hypothetical protein